MKEKVPIWCYKNQVFIKKFQSLQDAAAYARLASVNTVTKIARGDQPCTRDGYVFSTRPLTEEEIEKLPVKEKKTKVKVSTEDGGLKRCEKQVERQLYEVPCQNPTATWQARNKAERIRDFKSFLWHKFQDRWVTVPKSVATLERTYINEFLASI